MRKAKVYHDSLFCGLLEESDNGYRFTYSDEWYQDITKPAISLTLPKSQKVYESPKFFSFFDGLIPEGYLFKEVTRHWNIPTHDRFGTLLKSGADCIGAVTLEEVEE